MIDRFRLWIEKIADWITLETQGILIGVAKKVAKKERNSVG